MDAVAWHKAAEASMEGNTHALIEIISLSGAISDLQSFLDRRGSYDGWTLLHAAVYSRSKQTVEYLISQGDHFVKSLR